MTDNKKRGIGEETPIRDRIKERADNHGLELVSSIMDQSIERSIRRRRWIQLGIATGIIDGRNIKRSVDTITAIAIEEIKKSNKKQKESDRK